MGEVKTVQDAVAWLVREVGPERPIGEASAFIAGWLAAMLVSPLADCGSFSCPLRPLADWEAELARQDWDRRHDT